MISIRTLDTAIHSLNLEEYSVEHWIVRVTEAVKRELLATHNNDGSHDFGHLMRVTTLARQFAKEEGANELTVFAAAILHDIVNLPKNDPRAKESSLLASERAEVILKNLGFPNDLIPGVCHAIHAHSFSANVEARSLEAKCVQDADRMDALGALGLMRTFYVSGQFKSQLMHETDPAGLNRSLNDKAYVLDHFPLKLLTLQNTMKTDAGRKKAGALSEFLAKFRDEIISDQLDGNQRSGRFKIADVFWNAGSSSIALFHQEDPFALNRALEGEKYALDNLLRMDDPAIQAFLRQLELEIK